MKLLAVVVLVGALGFVRGFNNIFVANTCSVGSECIRCLSRTSRDLERCQQLWFYVTNTNTNNQQEMDRYCSGDCPIVLATAGLYCYGSSGIDELLRMCPSYNYVPTGSFGVNYNQACAYTATSGSCSHCLGRDNKDAVRCLQLYILASAQNFTSTYSSTLCEANCPTLLSTYELYCTGSFEVATAAYQYCQHNGADHCGALEFQYNSQLAAGAASCMQDCSSAECQLAISNYGCCLRERIGDACSAIPTCSLLVDVPIRSFNLDDRCPVAGCPECLARGSRKLEQCWQRSIFLTYVALQQDRNVLSDAAQRSTVNTDFCSSECLALMSTSNFYCEGIQSAQVSDTICPNYNVVPSASVDVTATYGSQRTCSVSQECSECIGRRSPEATRCQQLYSLTFHPNQSSYYLDLYCTSNCPLTFGTAGWYCNNVGVDDVFNRCMQRNSGGSTDFCASLMLQNPSEYASAVSNCVADCDSTACELAKNLYGCCLNMNTAIASRCNIQDCDIMTAGSSPVMVTSLTVAAISVLAYYLFN